MSVAQGEAVAGRRGRRRAASRPRPRVTPVGVLGELLITAGVVVLLFLGWQQWLNDLIVGGQLETQSQEQSKAWGSGGDGPAPTGPSDAEPIVGTAPGNAEKFALLIVPRFGDDYYRPIAEGVGTADVLNMNNLGHYPTTQMPGEVGNFAIASHRKAYGGNLEHINELRIGDRIYVETQDGWYSYVFRNLEYVQPTGVGVLDPVPQTDDTGTDRYITLTSCNPFFSTAERIIAYGVFEGWYPRDGGPPAEIAATVEG
jgi:sortase A